MLLPWPAMRERVEEALRRVRAGHDATSLRCECVRLRLRTGLREIVRGAASGDASRIASLRVDEDARDVVALWASLMDAASTSALPLDRSQRDGMRADASDARRALEIAAP